MQLILKKLLLRNFKKIKALEVEFGKTTTILGANRSGKTTIVDAFWWLLFDKSSTSRSDFQVKTTRPDGTVIHGLEHEVSGFFLVDGRDISFKKVYKEKWVKKRGSGDQVMDGHTTDHYVDDVPVSAGEYKKAVSALINEDMLKMVTSPSYFCSMPWKDQRATLEKMAGEITDIDMSARVDGLQKLLDAMNGKTIEQFRLQKASQKKPIQEKLEAIPVRIDEVDRKKPVPPVFEIVSKKEKEIEKEIAELRDSIENASKRYRDIHESNRKARAEADALEASLRELTRRITMEHEALKARIDTDILKADMALSNTRNEIGAVLESIRYRGQMVEALEKKITELREEFRRVSSGQIEVPEGATECHVCLQPLPERMLTEQRESMMERLQLQRKADLEKINEKGQQKNKEKERQEALILNEKESLATLNDALLGHEQKLKDLIHEKETIVAPDLNTPDIVKIKKDIERVNAMIQDIPPVDVDLEKQRVADLEKTLSEVRADLLKQDQIAEADRRIAELTREQRDLSQQIAEIEAMEFMAEQYERAKADMVEERVASLFRHVKFRMFTRHINGGIAQTCVCTLDGTEYQDLNTEGQINAGLDIINALSAHYNISAPIFLDNRDLVTDIIPVPAQVINMKVSPEHTTIKVITE